MMANEKFIPDDLIINVMAKIVDILCNGEGKASLASPTAPTSESTSEQTPDPTHQLDSRLFGSWTWSSVSSSYGYSMISSASVSVHETYVFMRDGRFIRRTDSFASQNTMMAFASTDAGDRGRWQVRGRNLVLDWDDNMMSEIDYFIASGTLELRLSSGPRYYLKN